MTRNVIISCALTGGARLNDQGRQFVPVTPRQLADETVAAARAGAAIAHIHVRDPETGAPSMSLDLYRETVELIRAAGTDILINLTTGPGARHMPRLDEPTLSQDGSVPQTPQDRTRHITELRPDLCSLDVATMNFGEAAIVNLGSHLRPMAETIRAAGVKPEVEVFDLGHVWQAADMVRRGELPSDALFQLCMGIPWGAPPTVEALLQMRALLPEGAVWSAFGIGRHQMPMVAQSALLGGHVRVGLEDNLYLRKGVLSPGNAPLVERAVSIIESLGLDVATPDQARDILNLARA
ncbi:3-keto-5-aminohexanoate cleavage protein [Pararhodobacter sp.]|uniref:3-keto-5-aminohexanoate cleavage protein n=1 Tax=Pararhodobacter sp. TaxID=2127056 RepID=UPI002FDD2DC9